MRINIRAFALSAGIVWGIGVMCLGWIAALGWGKSLVHVLAGLYLGFAASFFGGVIGGIEAFFDGLIGAALLAAPHLMRNADKHRHFLTFSACSRMWPGRSFSEVECMAAGRTLCVSHRR
jgi:hypothetical protein